jgi:hypothetical protein
METAWPPPWLFVLVGDKGKIRIMCTNIIKGCQNPIRPISGFFSKVTSCFILFVEK